MANPDSRAGSHDLYIDSDTYDAFMEAGGGDYISRTELAGLGQVFRSAEGCGEFRRLTGIEINGRKSTEEMFKLAAQGRVNLPEVLKFPSLAKYTKRRGPLALD